MRRSFVSLARLLCRLDIDFACGLDEDGGWLSALGGTASFVLEGPEGEGGDDGDGVDS